MSARWPILTVACDNGGPVTGAAPAHGWPSRSSDAAYSASQHSPCLSACSSGMHAQRPAGPDSQLPRFSVACCARCAVPIIAFAGYVWRPQYNGERQFSNITVIIVSCRAPVVKRLRLTGVQNAYRLFDSPRSPRSALSAGRTAQGGENCRASLHLLRVLGVLRGELDTLSIHAQISRCGPATPRFAVPTPSTR